MAAGLVLLLAVAAGLVLTPDADALWRLIRGHLADWRAFAAARPVEAAALFFAVYVLATGLSLPVATVLSLTAGAVFGRWVGTPLAVTAAACGATLAMLSSRYLLRDWVRARYGRRLAAVEAGVERDGAVYLLSLRLVPAVPYFLVNLGAGLTRLPAGTFFLASWAGMLPAAFVFVGLGTGAAEAESVRGLLSADLLAGLCLLGLLPVAGRWAVRRLRGTASGPA